MADTDALDRALRDGLAAATDLGPAVPAVELARALSGRRDRRRHRRLVRRVATVAAVVVLVAAGTVLWPSSEQATYVQTGPNPVPPGMLGEVVGQVAPMAPDALGPGWHRIDWSPLPPASPVGLAWAGEQLLVSLPGDLYAFHPASGTWTRLDWPPIDHPAVQFVAHAGGVYAIESNAEGGRSARLDLSTGRWARLGDTDLALAMATGGTWGPTEPGGLVGAVSTGDRLFDLKHGVVLDPGATEWRALPFPADLRAEEVDGAAVWTGTEVVLVTSASGGGLAWSADGTTVRRIPRTDGAAPSTDRTSSRGQRPFPTATGLAVDGGVLVVEPDGRSGVVDPATGQRTQSLADAPSTPGCQPVLATAGQVPLLTWCNGSATLDRRSGTWQTAGLTEVPVDPTSDRDRLSTVVTALGGPSSVVAWGPWFDEPDQTVRGSLAIWIPPPPGPGSTAGPIQSPEATPIDLAALPPGWHEVPTPVPATEGVASWNGRELFLGGGRAVYGFEPATGRWRSFPRPPTFGPLDFTFVATDTSVVAVGLGIAGEPAPLRSARLDLATGRWTELPPVTIAPALAAVGATGPGGRNPLIWTGSHVLDLRHGTTLALADPSRGWSPMAFPDDLRRYAGLLSATPVWSGDEPLLAAWSTKGGLAWSGDGATARELPGIPADIQGQPGFSGGAAAVMAGREMVVVTDGGLAAAFDTATGRWRRVATVPGMPSSEGCPDQMTSARGGVVMPRCSGDGSVAWSGDGWRSLGPTPRLARYSQWISTGGAVFAWAADTDTVNNADAPYSALFVLVPSG